MGRLDPQLYAAPRLLISELGDVGATLRLYPSAYENPHVHVDV
ncbi:MAG: hypothetical protein ACRDC4_06955 [Plesiomonas sp.]